MAFPLRHDPPDPAPVHPAVALVAPLLVGTDGNCTADPALHAAAVIAEHWRAPVQLFTVVEGVIPQRAGKRAPLDDTLARDHRTLLELAIRTQAGIALGTDPDWPLAILSGALGPTTRRHAIETGARLVIVARNHHSATGRILGRDSVMRIVEWAVTPVLVAAPDMTAAPSRIVVGVDFGRASLRAARIAYELLGEQGTLYLVHVCPMTLRGTDFGNTVARKLDEAQLALRTLRRTLRTDASLQIQPIVLFGRPHVELQAFADGVHADLVACGTSAIVPPATLRHRLHLGSVAAQLLDGTSCSMLIAPERMVE